MYVVCTSRSPPPALEGPIPSPAAAPRSPQEAALYPEFDPNIHLIVEYREADRPRRFRVDESPPKPRPQFVDTTPPGGAASFTKLPDPAALAKAMAESAGPSAEQFLAAAASSDIAAAAAAANDLPESTVNALASRALLNRFLLALPGPNGS